ncbi:diguanylate cyclase [Gallaecimonas kandeliae]|uniref:sensor domain-containing diguanylate cyclase n=1 Tax=Gallaecimonas kandeliae TaxID=3029055 RepID=UPI0026480C26|nr:sensor domain-containing diguanylate cyclase [Gallaecimonas kandeliae]WKE65622.1 diguanylate cyclase [Gallaecimonas kandeliae]
MFSKEQLVAFLKALPDPAFIITRGGLYAGVFGGTDQRYYHDGSSLVGKRLDEVLHAEKAAWFLEQIAQALDQQRLYIVEYGLAGKDVKGLEEGPAGVIWFEGRVQPLPFQVDGEDAVFWVASNITERHELELKLRHQSDTDELTGLHNRRRLMQTLRRHFDDFRRHGTNTALLLFDIDDFKGINDGQGHHQGDEALRLAARICRTDLRPGDFAARLGGDEFVVLMHNTSLDQALVIAERLRRDITAALTQLLGQDGTLSGGLSQFLPADDDSQAVLKRADVALYQAKGLGRDQLVTLAQEPLKPAPTGT